MQDVLCGLHLVESRSKRRHGYGHIPNLGGLISGETMERTQFEEKKLNKVGRGTNKQSGLER